MSDFTAIYNTTVSITRRPDLITVTQDAVKSATQKLHTRDFFPKDFFEVGIQFDTADYLQTLNVKELISRYRQLSYIRKAAFDGSSTVPGNFLTVCTPTEILDRYNVQKENICYQAGDSVQIKSSDQLTYIILGCYLYPDTNPDAYTSWIADEIPYLVALEAAKLVLGPSGNDTITRYIMAELQTQYPVLDAHIVAAPAV